MPESTNMQELEKDQVREVVSGHYARAVEAATENRGCCGAPMDLAALAGGESGEQAQILDHLPQGKMAAAAGYTEEQLAALPEDAVNASFGCGNPVNLAGLQPGDTVVDLGSGAGIDVLLAARIVGPSGHVIGVDMTDEMIEHAERNIAESGLTNVEIRRGLIEDLPVEPESVDWVVSNCVINLSPDKPAVFRSMAQALKPGGQFLISDIVVGDIPQTVRENVLGYVSCIGGAVSEDEYLRIIGEAGFNDAEVLLRHVYTQREMLGFAGYDDWPEGNVGEMARHLLGEVEGKIVSIKVRGRKDA